MVLNRFFSDKQYALLRAYFKNRNYKLQGNYVL